MHTFIRQPPRPTLQPHMWKNNHAIKQIPHQIHNRPILLGKRIHKKRRKQLKKIVTTLKELNKRKLTINIEQRTITIHHKLNEDHQYQIERSLRDTIFELKQNEEEYIIQKEKIKGA